MTTNPDLRILCLGAGVQSSALYRMAALGEFEHKPDYAIFADTQQEPPWVYETLEELERDHGNVIPILRPSKGDLGVELRDGLKWKSGDGRLTGVPFWVQGKDGKEAPGKRQCTANYKIEVVVKAIRELLGLKPRQRAAGKFYVIQWLGISRDEAHRMKPSWYSWIENQWPLIDKMMDRWACKDWLEDRGYQIPNKSACVFCPYRGPKEYAVWREQHPDLFEEACQFDDMIRSKGTIGAMKGQQYILRSLKPLRELPTLEELEGDGPKQPSLFGNECEGMCGV